MLYAISAIIFGGIIFNIALYYHLTNRKQRKAQQQLQHILDQSHEIAMQKMTHVRSPGQGILFVDNKMVIER